MKDRIVNILVRLIAWLDPNIESNFAPKVNGYEAGKVGETVQFTEDDIKAYMKKKGCSYAKATQYLIGERKKLIKVDTAKTIGDMMEFTIDKYDGYTSISGHIKVYKKL